MIYVQWIYPDQSKSIRVGCSERNKSEESQVTWELNPESSVPVFYWEAIYI